jgi:DNA polymerase III delta prime subunit
MAENAQNDDNKPKWHKELLIFNKIKPFIIMEGNIFDQFIYPEDNDYRSRGEISGINSYLYAFFKNLGYKNVVFYNFIKGFYNDCADEPVKELEEFCNLVNATTEPFPGHKDLTHIQANVDTATTLASRALCQDLESTVLVMDFASRYIIGPNNMTYPDVMAFTRIQQMMLDAREVRAENGSLLKNSLILLVNKVNDLPAWLFLNNPLVKTINILPPGKEERESYIDSKLEFFFDSDIYSEDIKKYSSEADRVELDKLKQRFVGLTEGFTYVDLQGLQKLCKNQHYRIPDFCNVVDLYRYGVKENPWQSLDIEKIKNAKEKFRSRVKGQDLAIDKTLDVIKRAITGMDGLQHSSHTKPKGILFFAGPTGTGKTETAKTLAENLFGDESKCIRFDMSEFSQSHSDQRLLGAPPGYVGYEAGGQLTNAVKNNPFSILLFDEIEKAHGTIFDKFLQILEDGRMTDSQGNTVYFSETVIIFTSNLGINVEDETGRKVPNVTPDDPYDEVREKVRGAIENHFKSVLNRPEILNRIGENIVVFDFIRPDVAVEILQAQLKKIVVNMRQNKNIELTFSDNAMMQLKTLALKNLANGGRGIGNIVETYFINPLSRFLFDKEVLSDASVTVNQIVKENEEQIKAEPLGKLVDSMLCDVKR